MTTTSMTEAERRDTALDLLAEIGGKLKGDDDITYRGTKFVLPENLSLREAVEFLHNRADAEEEENRYVRVYKYRPYDGAHATMLAVRELFGFLTGKATWSFFGKNPPQLIDIPVGYGRTEQVPWGAMTLPGLHDTTLHLGAKNDPKLGQVFQIVVDAPKKYRFHIQGLFDLVEKKLRENSIYRGQAITSECEYIDANAIDPTTLVYTESVQRRLEGDLWSFIRYDSQLSAEGQGGKYAVLLEGPFGSGKTEAAGVTAQIAVNHGWTFITSKPGEENLQHALEMARLYQPAVVFAEDVDTDANPQSVNQISRILDMMDGFHVKGQKLIVVFTTNHADRIHKGMLRPGRIGAVIHVGAMDRPGIEKLTRRVVGRNLMDDVDFDKVAEAMEGYMPAFVKEALNRAVRYTLAANEGRTGKIGTRELLDAADGLRDQLALMESAPTDPLSDPLSGQFHRLMKGALDGFKVMDADDENYHRFTLAAANGHGE